MFIVQLEKLTKDRSGWLTMALALLLSMFMVVVPLVPRHAHATDLEPRANKTYTASNDGQPNHFFRVAVNKTAILTLPSEAKEVVVGNNDIADVVIRSKTTVYIFGRKPGTTNMFFFDAQGRQIMGFDLEVAVDIASLQNLLRRELPSTRITADMVGQTIVLGGTAQNAAEAKTAMDLANNYVAKLGASGVPTQDQGGSSNVVNAIKIAGEDQVMLQVKMVEIQRDVIKQFGVNFGAVLNVGSVAFNLSNVNPFNNTLISPTQGYGIGFADGNGNSFTSILRAMESDGLLHLLAEPNLTTLSGQAASFKAGGEFPYQQCTNNNGNITCGIAFKDYGIGLDFTPTVLSEGRIHIKIHTTATDINQQQNGSVGNISSVPSLDVRAADTVLEMPDGGSMMLAGLIRETTRQTINGTPGLKSLPVLGPLFRSRDFQSNQTELVVLVTPHIVRSTTSQALEVPDKNLNIASDSQSILLGRLNKIYGSSQSTPAGSYSASVGYIVE